MIKAVLFDLDGTLLPMDTLEFARVYIRGLAQSVEHLYPIDDMRQAIWDSTLVMIRSNIPGKTNREIFEADLEQRTGIPMSKFSPHLEEFYRLGVPQVLSVAKPDPRAHQVVQAAKDKGLRCILATSPLFPQQVTRHRIHYAGLDEAQFEYITTYEHTYYTKPHLDYYREVLAHCGLHPEQCVMIGNDAQEDMVARHLGMKTFWATDYAMNHADAEPEYDAKGSFDEMLAFIQAL